MAARTLESAVAAAAKFEAEVIRLLYRSERTSRWLVRLRPSSFVGDSDDVAEESHDLAVLVLISQTVCQEAGFAFTEAQASESFAGAAIVDMCVDDSVGFALVFEYRTALSVGTIFEHRAPILGELATLLLGVLAISTRLRTLGYCLGALTQDVLGVDTEGSILVLEPGRMHASRQESDCCSHGVLVESVFALLTRWSDDVPTALLTDAARLALGAGSAENAVEVGMHVVNQIVTPCRIHLDASVARLPLAQALSQNQSSREGLAADVVNARLSLVTRCLQRIQGLRFTRVRLRRTSSGAARRL